MSIKDLFYESFGDLPSRRGPGGFYSYVKWQDVADRMNQIFGVNWSSEAISHEVIGDNVIVRVRVDVRDPETKEHFYQEGFGGAPLNQGEPGNPFKSAYSKALKDACKKWGIALYKDEEEVPPSAAPEMTSPPEMPATPAAEKTVPDSSAFAAPLPPNVPKTVQQEVTLQQEPPAVPENTPPAPATPVMPEVAPVAPAVPEPTPPPAAAVEPPIPQQPAAPVVPEQPVPPTPTAPEAPTQEAPAPPQPATPLPSRPADVPLNPTERVKRAKQQATPPAPEAPVAPATPAETPPAMPSVPGPDTGLTTPNPNPAPQNTNTTEGQITGVQKVAIEGLLEMKGLNYDDVTVKALGLPEGSTAPAIETLTHSQAISVIRHINNDVYK